MFASICSLIGINGVIHGPVHAAGIGTPPGAVNAAGPGPAIPPATAPPAPPAPPGPAGPGAAAPDPAAPATKAGRVGSSVFRASNVHTVCRFRI